VSLVKSMRRRKFLVLLGGTAAAWPLAARAQQVAGPRHVGLLMAWKESDPEVQGWLTALREALGKLGWREGQNVLFEFRWAGTDPNIMQQAAKELVLLQPDLIVSSSSPTTAFLLKQTHTIPLVFVNIVDPVGQGFAASMSRPGGNATGLVNLEPSMAGKWIELLKEVMPGMARVAIPFNPATSPYADFYLNYFKSTATSFGAEVIVTPVPDIAALETFAAAQAREPNTGLVPVPSGFMQIHGIEIAAMMARYHLPAIHFDHTFVEAGGLLAYGNDVTDNYRLLATFVDRILRGEKPSDLPIQFPVKFELAINLKTAKALGLRVPQTLLATADEVIE
jgi:putative tryptophan/tyrosine transport system substrate-binding protein